MLERRLAERFASRILLVEDEESLAAPLKRGLEEEGHHVVVAPDGEQGLTQALTVEFDLLIVDWRLPGLDGRTLVERVRGAQIQTPVLMLTALRDVDHRVAGLDAGADDYLTKPFAFEELLARLRSLRRRTALTDAAAETAAERQTIHLHAGTLHMDTARRTADLGDRPLGLRTKEYRLLELLLRYQGEVATRTLIAERVWGSPFDVTDNAIDVTVSNLRQRLSEAAGAGQEPVVIETVRGAGYRLCVPQTDPSAPGGA